MLGGFIGSMRLFLLEGTIRIISQVISFELVWSTIIGIFILSNVTLNIYAVANGVELFSGLLF